MAEVGLLGNAEPVESACAGGEAQAWIVDYKYTLSSLDVAAAVWNGKQLTAAAQPGISMPSISLTASKNVI